MTPARGRMVVAAVLVVVGALLAPLSVAAIWIHEKVLDTDGYVATVAPLADDPVIVDAVATRVVDTMFERADVVDKITGVLPGPVDALGQTFVNSLRDFATGQARGFLESSAFQSLWEKANHAAHEQVVKMFTGKSEAVVTRGDRVVLDLGVAADKVRDQLVDKGVGILKHVPIPANAVELTLAQSDAVPKLQPIVRTLNSLATVLPVLTAALIVAAVAIANRRRRIVIALGLSVAAAALLLLGAMNIARRQYLDAIAAGVLNLDVARAVFDTLTTSLVDWAWILVGVGVLTALGAYVSDPRRIERLTRWLHGDRLANRAGVAPWVGAHRALLRLGAVGVAIVVLAVWPSPTWLVLVLLAVALAIVLGVITALVRMASAPPEAAEPRASDA